MQQPIGTYLDDDDALFNWLHSVAIGLPVMHFACRSGLAEAVAIGPVSVDAFAARTGLPADKLRRIANYLAAHGLIDIGADGTMLPNTRTARLGRLHGLWQQMINTTTAGSALLECLQTGRTAFEVKFGRPVFEHFALHPELGAQFASFMSFMTQRMLAFLYANYAFEPFETAVDLGGSEGDLLAHVLAKHPKARGILFDLPEVVARALNPRESSRVSLVGGDFFHSVPAADLYLLKQILHDWDDAQCVRILANVRQAIAPGGKVVILDHLLGAEAQVGESLSTDIAMMIWANGHERTREQFAGIFRESGFRTGEIVANPRGHSVIEAIPV